MATEYIRSYNPIWFLNDHTGKPLDDTYYAFFLENEIPYIPQPVYHTPSGTEWTNPVQFTPAGSLPIDLYFDPEKVYRIEIRHGNTQQDELIWLIENYVPSSQGDTPIPPDVSIASDNQIVNPQFVLVSFTGNYSINSAGEYTIAPGWVLELTGSGSATISHIPLTSNDNNPTNAPYALRLQLSGWNEAVLKQRFNQNGIFLNGQQINAQTTARLVSGASGSEILAQLHLSTGDTAIPFLFTQPLVIGSWVNANESMQLEEWANTDIPPDAWVEFQLFLPNVTVDVTSVQVSQGLSPIYDADSVERQIDHTFHYYYDSILLEPKDSILTGWDFGLNPWQFRTTTISDVTVNQYVADQTIVIQQDYVQNGNGSRVQAGQGTAAQNHALIIQAKEAQNKFALLQYIPSTTMLPHWNGKMSVCLRIKGNVGTSIRFKVRLFSRASVPNTVSQTDPIAVWNADDPTLAAGYTFINSASDSIYTIDNDEQVFAVDNFILPASSNANSTLGILVYTLDNMNTSGTPDSIEFHSISLVPNEFAIESNPLTFDESLRRCQYFYEKSYPVGVLPGVGTATNQLVLDQVILRNSGILNVYTSNAFFQLKTTKVRTPTLTFYSPADGASASVRAFAILNGTAISAITTSILNYQVFPYLDRVWITSLGSNPQIIANGADNTAQPAWGQIQFHYTADARLGV